jgi:cytochrome c oxidase subunit II
MGESPFIAMFRQLAQKSSYASDIDGLIILIGWIVGVWFLIAEAVFFYLIFRYRHRDGHKGEYVTGEEKHQKRWITIPHALVLVCDIFIIVGAVRVWYDIKQDLPQADSEVRIIAQQWAWSFVQPGPDGQLDTADDIKTVDDLHVEVGKTYHYHLEARDVLHDFSVPVFRLKQDAIPGRVITGWWKATETGVHDIQCAEICGIGHGLMFGRIHIESPAEHAAWMQANTPVASIAALAR